MATEIINNGASLKIITGGATRLITKFQIREISIVKTNIIKLDTGQGIHNLFVGYADVTNPVTPSPEALRDAINAMLSSGNSSATEAKQDNE